MDNRDNNQDNKIIVLETNYKTMSEKIDELKKSVEKGFSELKNEFKCIREENANRYVSKEKFEPVRAIAYGFVGIVMTAVVVAIITLVLV
jgi:peptidoglycan hydrolase CwlO-like protein